MLKFWRVEPEWSGQTCAVIAGGPSLTQAQVDRVRGLKVIAVNDAYRLAPWADIVYFCDPRWYDWHRAALASREGLIVRLQSPVHDEGDPRVRVLKDYGSHLPFVEARDGVANGRNSGHQALHLAVHLGAARILLLGFDCKWDKPERRHWFGNHPDNGYQPVEAWIEQFGRLAAVLRGKGVQVINCSPDSALQCFEKADIASLLPDQVDAELSA